MSALWIPGRAGVSPRGSWWQSPALPRCGTTATAASDPASSAAPSPRHPGAHLLSLGGRLIARDPAPATWGPITRHQRHDLKHRALSGAHAKARRPWFNADPARTEPAPPRVGPSRSTPRGSGSTDRGLCVLHEGPTYPQYPQPSSSSTPPSCSTSRRHRQPPQSPGQPPPTSPSNSSPIRQTHPGGVLRSHDIRNSQKT